MRNDAIQTVSDLMTGDLVSIHPTDRCGEALDILMQSGLHALPAIDDHGVAVGLITTSDLVAVDPEQTVDSRFSGPPITVDKATTVARAAAIMRAEYVHHLIVTDGTVAVGMLSSFDLLKLLEPNV